MTMQERIAKEIAELTKGVPFEKRNEVLANYYCKIKNDEVGSRTGYDCKLCKNKAVVYKPNLDDPYSPDAYYCRCENIRTSLARLEKTGLIHSIKNKTFDKFVTAEKWQEELKQAAMTYAGTNTTAWLIICGAVGSGKSHLCTAIVRQFIFYGFDLRYMPYADTMIHLKAARKDSDKYFELVQPFKTCDVLYIDDLFKGSLTAVDPAIMFEIIDYRYKNNLRTILSTEKTCNQLIDVDEAVGTRILEQCRLYKYEISRGEGKNYRLNDTHCKQREGQTDKRDDGGKPS